MRYFFKIAIVAAVFMTAFSLYADARPRGGGGGHGGGIHMGGGRGGAHFGGGRAFHGGGARFGGAHFGGGGRHFGGARFGGPRHFGGARQFRGSGHFGASRSFVGPRGYRNMGRAVNRGPRNAARAASRRAGKAATANRATRMNLPRANAVRERLRSRSVNGALRNRNALRNPAARTALAAAAATAGWHGWNHGRHHGWWRHRHGGYGWVGPLFWPFAYYDLYDYGLWGYDYGPAFWDYGYGDIYAGLFSPYGYDSLSGYMPARRTTAPVGKRSGTASDQTAPPSDDDQLAQMCGADSGDIAGLPIDKIQQAIAPNDEQRAALDELGNASVKAAQTIRAACPATLPLTAPARLAVMEQRIEAMRSAIGIIQPAMEKFYGLLDDEQKAKLTAMSPRDKQGDKATASADGSCGITSLSDAVAWPTDEINKRLQPSDEQKTKLAALQDVTFKAADSLKATCRPSTALTPPARLAAAGERLEALLGAVKSVHAALNDFYGTLSDEQKAQFEAIGPDRSGKQRADNADADDQPVQRTSRRHRRHHGIHGMNSVLRHIITIVR